MNQRIGPSKVMAAGCPILAGLGHIAPCNAVNVPMYLIAMCCGRRPQAPAPLWAWVIWWPCGSPQETGTGHEHRGNGLQLLEPCSLSRCSNVLAGSIGMPDGLCDLGGVAAAVGVIGMALLRDTPQGRGASIPITSPRPSSRPTTPPRPRAGQLRLDTGKLLPPRRPGCALCPPAF